MAAEFLNKAISGITATGAIGGGSYTTTGDTIVLYAYGVVWATHSNPTSGDSKTIDGSGTSSGFTWTSSLTGLLPNTKYYVMPYIIYSGGFLEPNISAEVNFTTLVALPTVTTTVLSPITATGATGGGNVTNAGGGTITARGVAWGTSTNPTISDSHTTQTGTTGSFVSSLTGLLPSTTYHVRAYATNSAGTAYGADVTGKTLATVIHLTTLAVSGVTNTTATSGGKVTGITGGTVFSVGIQIQKGVETGRTTIIGSYGGLNIPFVIPITGLIPEEYYTIQAYAVTTGGVINLASGVAFTMSPNPPQVNKITQPVSPNETGSVSFINLPNHANTLRWSGTATGSTNFAATGVTITGLTVGTYLFSIKINTGTYYSPTTSVTIKATENVQTEISSTGYKLFERTGLGDGAAFDAAFAEIDHTIFVEVTYTPEEIIEGNIK
jgi:hypothetical protein